MIRFLLFDLDNTLYPSSTRIEEDLMRRMVEYTAFVLDQPYEEAWERRLKEMPRYGTTLEWLMSDYGFEDSEAYFSAVHPEGEEEYIDPNPALGDFLRSLPYPKAIFTNSTMEHTDRVLRKLGFPDAFEAIFDIRFNHLKGKPHPAAGLRVCAALGVNPSETLFVDDVPRYVKGFVECGGNGILLDDRNRHSDVDSPRIASLYEIEALLANGMFCPEPRG